MIKEFAMIAADKSAQRDWRISVQDTGFWLTFGVHVDCRHPMLTLFISRAQINIGRHYGTDVIGGIHWSWNDPNQWREHQ